MAASDPAFRQGTDDVSITDMRRSWMCARLVWSAACGDHGGDTTLNEASVEEFRDLCLWIVVGRYKRNMGATCNYTTVRDATTTAECIERRDDCLVDRSYGWLDFGTEARSDCAGIRAEDLVDSDCSATLTQLRTCYTDRWILLGQAAASATCEQPGVVATLEVPASCARIQQACPREVATALGVTDGSH